MTPDKTFPIEIGVYNKLCQDRDSLLKALEELTEHISLAQSGPKRIMAHANALYAIAKAKAES